MGPTATDQEASSGSRNTASAVPSSSSVSGQQQDLTSGEQENADVDRGQKNEEISQQQSTSGTSSSSAAKLVGRFHIRPLRGALDGLSSLFSGRGGGSIKGKGREEMPKKAEDRKQKEEDDNDEKKMRREEEDEFGRKRRRDVDGNGNREEIAKVDEQEMVDTAAGEENAEDEDVNEDEDQPAGEEKREQQQPTTSSASATGFKQPKMEEENEDELLQPIEVRQQPRLTGEAAGGKAAPEPKPRRRLRRGSSLVHPMEAAETVGRAQPQVDDQDTNSGLAMRPRSLSVRHLQKALEPSQPSEWIYVQMPDRTFKRTTEAELQLMSRRSTLEKLPLDPSTLPEFAAVSAAIGVQRGFHAVATLLQGFLSGLAFAHAVFAFSLPGAESRLRWLAQFYAEMAAPVQAIFYVGLAIAVVDSMDRLNFGAAAPTASQLFWRCFLSPAFANILCWTAALLASLSSTQIDEYFGNGNLAALQRGDRLLLAVWRWAIGARAGFAVLGWILAAFGRAEDGGILAELHQTMANPIPQSQYGDGQQAEDRQNQQMTIVVDDVQNKV